MSKYDPDDGYEACTQCGELTTDVDRVCGICRGDVSVPKKKTSPSRSNLVEHYDPQHHRRNRRKGFGWKKAHES